MGICIYIYIYICATLLAPVNPVILLMIEILRDFKLPKSTKNPRNYGSIVFIGSCRIYITISLGDQRRFSELQTLPPAPGGPGGAGRRGGAGIGGLPGSSSGVLGNPKLLFQGVL